MAEPAQILRQYLKGEAAEANTLQQLLHLYKKDARMVLAALGEQANSLVANYDGGPAGIKMGNQLIRATVFLDKQTDTPIVNRGVNVRLSCKSRSASASQQLLDHLLLLAGDIGKAAKQRTVRVQNCSLIASLAPSAPGQRVQEKLLEFAQDKVPAVREKAVVALAAMEQTPEVERVLLDRTSDLVGTVRQAAICHMKVTPHSIVKLLDRASDVQVLVRTQVFEKLAEQPDIVGDLGPASYARFVLGLLDRSSLVRQAATKTMEAWHKKLGGLMPMVTRLHILDDEQVGEMAAAALVSCFPAEGENLAKSWLVVKLEPPSKKARTTDSVHEAAAAAIIARHAIVAMRSGDRDDVVDIPGLLTRTRSVLDQCKENPQRKTINDFTLRQLLLIMLSTDLCEDSMRHQASELAEAVLLQAPLPDAGLEQKALEMGTRQSLNSLELGMVLLRKSCGLADTSRLSGARLQAREAECSTRVAMLLGDACPAEEENAEGGEGFTQRLSNSLLSLNEAVAEAQKKKAKLESQKKSAAAAEDFMKAHDAKSGLASITRELNALEKERNRVKSERDGVCLRVVGIITALLRWTQTDLRRDHPLTSIFQHVLAPTVRLPALTPEVEVASLRAICLFCSISSKLARSHWGLLTTLISNLKDTSLTEEVRQKACACAGLAAQALADCCLYHGTTGSLDNFEVLGAGIAMAVVPYDAREVVIRPLCKWLLSSGAVFVDEHCQEPVLEVQWALGWLLVEAMSVSSSEDDNVSESARAMGAHLWDFFNFLVRHPGRHVKPMLSLAVESVAESGLWRRSVLKPLAPKPGEAVNSRWQRGFSWPQLFAFAHEQLPPEMRFRLWRCSLQLCVASPEHAPLAEVPAALLAAVDAAPPGAAELVKAAMKLGADSALLTPLQQQLPALDKSSMSAQELLQPKQHARSAETERRNALAGVGVDIETWAPGGLEPPKALPPTVRLRARAAARKGEKALQLTG
mmetsp:Transcript_30142/g.54993  ORF Transcript_30142/g.54993 Transcript_30142/m.54993 type:complete len:978 (+) Transcript_30142:73-3006(+)